MTDSLKNFLISFKKKAVKKTALFQKNIFHPSLHLEKLNPRKHEVWSFRVDRSYRVIFVFIDGSTAEFWYIGPHHLIYDFSWFSPK